MKYPEKRSLFTMKDICRACNLSRATLIRMEESGFLTPYKIDENTGYRYYDADNIAQIGQYRILQELGLSRNEITEVYYRKFDAEAFIAEQQKKIRTLQNALSKFELAYTKSRNGKFSFAELPEVTCYCVKMPMEELGKMETNTFLTYETMIKEGFKFRGEEPFFAYFDKADTTKTKKIATICIPIVSDDTESPFIKKFPAQKAFTLVGYGNYLAMKELNKLFEAEVVKRKLKPTGPTRLIFSVAAYTGAHISPDDYCCMYALPVDDDI